MNAFLKKLGLVLIGGTVQGLGMGLFLFPNSIPSGGAGGITILLHHIFNFNTGLSLWVVNFLLLLFVVKFLGKRFALWTVVGITVASLTIEYTETYLMIDHRNLIYDLVVGSVFLGTGIGLLMRQGVSNGGVGVIAFMIASGRNILPGKPLFIINSIIFVVTGIVIHWKIIFLALISQWISTNVIDIICRITFYETYTLGWRKKP